MHREWTERAAHNGIHVLCEKPMALNSEDCRVMIGACRQADVRLMIAYRLHFEPANLRAIDLIRRGKIGEPRFFSSSFSMQVKDPNIRVEGERGGGPLYDLGVYCINAARYLFGSNPIEVAAFETRGHDRRFDEVEESFTALMRFPDDLVASFTCSFGAADTAWFQVVGTKGDICLDSAYEYQQPMEMMVTVKDKTKTQTYKKKDQFAPELIHFAQCIRTGREPEPGAHEGLIDVHIIESLQESARTGHTIQLQPLPEERQPRVTQAMRKPPVQEKGELVRAESAHQD
jgi:predicted dehydrogenase